MLKASQFFYFSKKKNPLKYQLFQQPLENAPSTITNYSWVGVESLM